MLLWGCVVSSSIGIRLTLFLPRKLFIKSGDFLCLYSDYMLQRCWRNAQPRLSHYLCHILALRSNIGYLDCGHGLGDHNLLVLDWPFQAKLVAGLEGAHGTCLFSRERGRSTEPERDECKRAVDWGEGVKTYAEKVYGCEYVFFLVFLGSLSVGFELVRVYAKVCWACKYWSWKCTW